MASSRSLTVIVQTNQGMKDSHGSQVSQVERLKALVKLKWNRSTYSTYIVGFEDLALTA